MNTKRVIASVVLALMIAGCGSSSLSQQDLVMHGVSNCPNVANMSILSIPSRGAIADTLMANSVNTTHNDGGFYEAFKKEIRSGAKSILVYSPSQQKLEAIVAHTLSLFPKDSLDGISLCVVGLDSSDAITSQAQQTGIHLSMKKR